jgi:hypothetical protein
MSDTKPFDVPVVPTRRHIRRASDAIKEIHTLVALESHDHDGSEGEGKTSIWREAGQAPVPIKDFRTCLQHSATGALS